MQKTCKKCSIHFEITSSDLDFYKKISPKFDGKTFDIPTPTLCPDCRQQRRLSFRNERNLYKRECDATGKNIISIYSPDKKLKVYNSDFWWSDNWDALDYGIDFDFNKSFFEQFGKLMKDVPFPNLIGKNNENSPYTNHVAYNKNCYLCFNTGYSEDCYYISNYCLNDNNCVDCTNISDSEYCFECTDVLKSYNSKYLYYCDNMFNSSFCYDCHNCKNCVGCFNLTNKEYYINNIGYSKEDYFKKIEEYVFEKSFKEFLEKIKEKADILKNIKNNTISSTGDYLLSCKNVNNSFYIRESENCKYSYDGTKLINCMDVTEPYNGEKQYETHACNDCNNILFCNSSYENNNIIYCYNCFNSSNFFGCVGLKNKSYCILNKQYTKEEYNKLVPKIIEKMKADGEWGEFFPASLSPFGYNETVAQEYFPLGKEEIIKQNFNYSEYENPKPNVEKIIPADKLPENIAEIPDDILNWAIKCEVSGKPFRIIKQELEFYRKHNLPIPHKHPDIRHFERMKLRNPRK